MNWQDISIERLKEYEDRKRAAENISEQIKALKLEYASIKSAATDEIPVKGGGCSRENALINNIVKRQELRKNLAIVKSEIRTTERGLEVLTNDQRLILHKFFISRPPNYIDDLCEELFVERSRLYILKNRALKRFTIACYGVIEI